MDVSMPFMGGMEATELIRSYEMHRGLSPTPIIALTAHASMSFTFCRALLNGTAVIGDRERCLQAGMDDHITSKLRESTHETYSLTCGGQNPCGAGIF